MTDIVYYRTEEILKNDGKSAEKTWIIFKNCVYDVTDFLAKDEHPGGIDLILEYGGKCATKAFNDVGHSEDAKNMLAKYKIGEVAQEDRKIGIAKDKASDGEVNKLTRSCLSRITCGFLN
ncbi:hypothetical protein RI129_007461 [Pyrocoelia pectoralis]|uniref:Cytochrome b5 n=1 Tax=Pyrocoelia pectoralis TaxID=417401 RepID=A0AAN7VDN1_9COLE